MKDYLTKSERVRMVIISFSVFSMFVLFQPERYGSLVGAITLFLTIGVGIINKDFDLRRLMIRKGIGSLLLFMLLVLFVTSIKVGSQGFSFRFYAQIVLCALCSNIDLRRNENELIKNIYLTAITFYSILVIYNCYRLGSLRGYHTDIPLLGALWDPNYLGIPIITGMTISLYKFLFERRRVIYLLLYTIFFIAIVYTSSRGNYLGFVISNSALLYFYFRNKDISLLRRIMIMLISVLAILLIIHYISKLFPAQWSRMSAISSADDNGRFELWQISFDYWKRSPIFGNGFLSMSRFNHMVSHNTYLQLLTETGIVGTVLFFLFFLPNYIHCYGIDKCLFVVLSSAMFQIIFLDALDNRAIWILFVWLVMLPAQGFENVELKTD